MSRLISVPVDPSDPLVVGAGALGAYLAGDDRPQRAALFAFVIATLARLVVDVSAGNIGEATAFRALAAGALAALATAARVARAAERRTATITDLAEDLARRGRENVGANQPETPARDTEKPGDTVSLDNRPDKVRIRIDRL